MRKTAAAKSFGMAFASACIPHWSAMRVWARAYRPADEAIRATLSFYFPRAELVTKGGAIMKRRHDLDNMLKCTMDELFRQLGVDDSAVIAADTRKFAHGGNGHAIELRLERIPVAEIFREIPVTCPRTNTPTG